jgi:hypothetical protein
VAKNPMEFVVTKWQNIFKAIVELNDVFTLVLEWARMQGQILIKSMETSSLYSTITKQRDHVTTNNIENNLTPQEKINNEFVKIFQQANL